MYGLMVAFETMRVTPLAGGRNEGLNFGNVVAKSKGTGNRDHGGGDGTGIKQECWHCGWEHLKRNCPKSAEEKEKKERATEESTINALTERQR